MELKEIVETLGFKVDQFKTVEDFKTEFEKSFIRTSSITEDNELVKPIIGKIFGTIENDLKVIAKKNELDIDFNDEDFKGKKFKNKVEFFATKLNEKNKSIIDDLTLKAGQGNDEKIKDYEKKLSKKEQEAKDLKALLDSTSSEYTSFKENSEKQIKGVKLNIIKKDAFAKLKLKPEITEIEKKGFDYYIAEKYSFDIDEQENIVVTDKKGAKIPSTKVVGTFKCVDEILEEEAITNKIYSINKDAGAVRPKPIEGVRNANPNPIPSPFARKVADPL